MGKTLGQKTKHSLLNLLTCFAFTLIPFANSYGETQSFDSISVKRNDGSVIHGYFTVPNAKNSSS